MREKIVEFIRSRKFETAPQIKKEFSEFLDWYKAKVKEESEAASKSTEQLMSDYFREKDIALHGQISRLKNVSKRNPNMEILAALATAVLGFLLTILLINLFI
ncbi:MAG: hypothetical protein AABY15_02865 [Nanoarchaeota archaeon]